MEQLTKLYGEPAWGDSNMTSRRLLYASKHANEETLAAFLSAGVLSRLGDDFDPSNIFLEATLKNLEMLIMPVSVCASKAERSSLHWLIIGLKRISVALGIDILCTFCEKYEVDFNQLDSSENTPVLLLMDYLQDWDSSPNLDVPKLAMLLLLRPELQFDHFNQGSARVPIPVGAAGAERRPHPRTTHVQKILIASPLDAAIHSSTSGSTFLAVYLIDVAKVDVNNSGRRFAPPILHAVSSRRYEIAYSLLCRKDIDVDVQDGEGFTVLHRFVSTSSDRDSGGQLVREIYDIDISVMEQLLKRSDINAKTFLGRTALMLAIDGRSDQVVRDLLGRDDLDIQVKDRSGKSARSWAETSYGTSPGPHAVKNSMNTPYGTGETDDRQYILELLRFRRLEEIEADRPRPMARVR